VLNGKKESTAGANRGIFFFHEVLVSKVGMAYPKAGVGCLLFSGGIFYGGPRKGSSFYLM